MNAIKETNDQDVEMVKTRLEGYTNPSRGRDRFE